MDKYQKGWNGFAKVCRGIEDEKLFSLFFDFFLTPEEKADLSMRYLLIKELLKGEKTQRQIAQDLNVSIAKITRGSNELKRANRKLLQLLKEKIGD